MNWKNTLSVCLLGAGLLSACQGSQNYQLSGTIKGVPTDSLVMCVINLESMRTERIDTIPMQDGTFQINLPDTVVKSVSITSLPADGKPLFSDRLGTMELLVLPNERITVKGTLSDYELGGSDFYIRLNEVRKLLLPIMEEVTKLRVKYEGLMQQELDKDSLSQAYIAEYAPLQKQLQEMALDYIGQHPDDEVSVYLLSYLGENMKQGLQYINDEVKNGRMKAYYQPILAIYEARKLREQAAEQIQPGKDAPVFTANDLNGKAFSLTSLKGKYVALDFWGSWCKWCIKGFPKMKEAYARHKGKVEFVGIACQDTEIQWKAAVDKNQLPWINVRNADGPDISAVYAIQAYPTKIIIDPEGKIVKVFVGEDPDFYTFLETL